MSEHTVKEKIFRKEKEELESCRWIGNRVRSSGEK